MIMRHTYTFTLNARYFYPLTISAESSSALREIFTSDSSNFFFNKRFLQEIFSSSGSKDIRILRFFLFCNVWTYFLSKNCEIF